MQRSLMGLFLLALTLGILALAGMSLRSAVERRMAQKAPAFKAHERVFAVNVVTARATTSTPVIETYGEIRSRRTLDIRAPIAGNVVELGAKFIEGGHVRKGDLLVRLDPADALSALKSVETDRREAEAELQQAGEALQLAKDDVAGAKGQRALRRAALARQRNLTERGVGTEAAVEGAALADAAATQLVLAKRQAMAQADARVSRAKIALSRIELRLQDARRRLADTTIRASFDGVLGPINVIKGGVVGGKEKLARLIDPRALEVVFRVSDSQFLRLDPKAGGAISGGVRVRLDGSGSGQTIRGTMDRVSPEVGTGRTGRQIFARLPAAAASVLRSGDFVSVEVDEPPLANVVLLPATAVDSDGFVLVLGPDERLQEKKVTVLRKQRDRVILRADALIGRDVVKARSPLLGAGIRVKPLRKGAAVSPQPPALIQLSAARRAALVGFIKTSKVIPTATKARLLARLKQDRVPADMVKRIESRMGG